MVMGPHVMVFLSLQSTPEQAAAGLMDWPTYTLHAWTCRYVHKHPAGPETVPIKRTFF